MFDAFRAEALFDLPRTKAAFTYAAVFLVRQGFVVWVVGYTSTREQNFYSDVAFFDSCKVESSFSRMRTGYPTGKLNFHRFFGGVSEMFHES